MKYFIFVCVCVSLYVSICENNIVRCIAIHQERKFGKISNSLKFYVIKTECTYKRRRHMIPIITMVPNSHCNT